MSRDATSALELRVASPGHLVTGLVLIGFGTAGMLAFWDAFGLVGRGVVPPSLAAAGVIMIAAGVRSIRERRGRSPRVDAVAPLVVSVASLVVAAAAASGLSVDAVGALEPLQIAGYMGLGLVSGIVGGMLGLGGGVVHLAGMTLLFGFSFGFARGATLINNVFINAAAATRYGHRGLLTWTAVRVLLPSALVGVTIGSLVQTGMDEHVLRKIFAVFILVVTAAIVADTTQGQGARFRSEAALTRRSAFMRYGTAGAVAGMLSGILGISGGIVAVPGQTLFAKLSLRNAIANSTLITSLSSALGAALLVAEVRSSAMSGAEMVTIALLFIPGNLIGGHFGAIWMERLPVSAVRGFFVTALVAIAIKSWS